MLIEESKFVAKFQILLYNIRSEPMDGNRLCRKLPREVPIKIAVGVANPSAQGQETTCRVYVHKISPKNTSNVVLRKEVRNSFPMRLKVLLVQHIKGTRKLVS